MKTRKSFLIAAVFLFITFSCQKEYSDKRSKKENALPDDYPYACGLCDGVSLGIAIADTVDYTPQTTDTLPSVVSLDMPVPGNQGAQGSCTAWAVVYAAGTYYAHTTTGRAYSDTGNLSPKFTYNQITKGNCTCTSFLDNLYLLKTQGACSWNAMPYDPSECLLQPDSVQKEKAEPFQIKGWAKLNMHDLEMIRRAVAEKNPVLFSIKPDDGFNTMRPPYIWKQRVGAVNVNLHAMVITGYDDSKHCFRVMNSWSSRWADGGFIWIDYDFFLQNVGKGGYIVL